MTEDNARPLGEWLRLRREELDISLEQADEDTRIRTRYLEALEAEDLEALPNKVVTRGFLRNYASYLELDPQEAIERYAAITGPGGLDPLTISESSPFDSGTFQPVALHEMPGQGRRWWLPVALLVILAGLLALLAWQGYPYWSRWLPSFPVAGQPTATQYATSVPVPTTEQIPTATIAVTRAAAAASASTATEQPASTQEATAAPTLTLTPSTTPSPSPSATSTKPIYTGVFLELAFNEISWIQVTVDEIRQFQGELEAGTYRSWYGDQRIELRVGNAGAVDATVNGQKIGPLGAPGEVVDRIFEIVDDQVTEATPTSGPTLTVPELTATAEAPIPTAAITPVPSIAPTITATATASP